MKTLTFFLTLLVFSTNCSSTSESRRSEIEFGKLEVPENRNDSDSRNISLSYVYIPKTGSNDYPPMIFLQGGPGGSSLLMQNFFSNSPLRKNHDIILFDARGTGSSEAHCQEVGLEFLSLMAKDLTIQEEYEGTLELCKQCKKELESNNVDLAGYNSLENAADVEALRKHLGIDKWILLGGSYGTRLGLTYMREYKAAEAAILMGLFPLEVNIYEGFVEGFNGALEYLFETCASDPDCNGRYPNFRSVFYETIEKLRTNPKSVQYQGEDFVINAQDALLLIHQMLYGRGTIQQVPAFVQALNGGETRVINQSINSTAARLSAINIATYLSVQAAEEVQFNDDNSFENQLSTYPDLKPGPAFFATDQKVLNQWHSHRSKAKENKRVNVKTPMLITNGIFDPITPIVNARNVMEYLPNATLVEFPLDGHSTFNSCFFNMVEDFVESGYKPPNASCVDDGSLSWR